MNDAFNILRHTRAVAGCLLLLACQVAAAAPMLTEIQSQWDTTNFALTGKPQIAAFEQLQLDSEAYTTANSEQAEGWVWRGIVDSSFAGAKGGLGALGLAKQARKHFDKAIEIDGDVMGGSAYSSLGTLYFSVPGWPIGFGNNDKAAEYLQKGLSLDPDGMDSNFFYAEFMVDQKKPVEARQAYQKALNAAPRPRREVADAGRRKEIQAALAALDK